MNRIRSLLEPRVQAVLLLVLVAAIGVLVGITVERLRAAPTPQTEAASSPGEPREARRFRRPARPPRRASIYIELLERELDLSPAQRARIERILVAQQERFRETMREVEPQLREAAVAARREIVDVLDEEQKREFRSLRPPRQAGGRADRPFLSRPAERQR